MGRDLSLIEQAVSEFVPDEVNNDGSEMEVLIAHDQPFLLKKPVDLQEAKSTKEGYELAKKRAGGIVAPFTITNKDGSYVVAQQKALVVEHFLDEVLYKPSVFERNINIAQQLPLLDQELLKRGLCMPDPFFKNYGVIDDCLFLLDPGKLCEGPSKYASPNRDEHLLPTSTLEESYFNMRGYVLYWNAFELHHYYGGPDISQAYTSSIPSMKEPMVFGIYPEDYEQYTDLFMKTIYALPGNSDELKRLVEKDTISGLKKMFILYEDAIDIFLPVIMRTKHHEEFTRLAKAEHETYFGSSRGEPVEGIILNQNSQQTQQ